MNEKIRGIRKTVARLRKPAAIVFAATLGIATVNAGINVARHTTENEIFGEKAGYDCILHPNMRSITGKDVNLGDHVIMGGRIDVFGNLVGDFVDVEIGANGSLTVDRPNVLSHKFHIPAQIGYLDALGVIYNADGSLGFDSNEKEFVFTQKPDSVFGDKAHIDVAISCISPQK